MKRNGEDDTTARGKYGLVSVPGYEGDKSSFIRMGAPSTTWERDPGGDLARRAHDTGFSTEGAHARGGAHEHTDGDRVSTTRGNKIDVVSGGYKLHIERGPNDAGTGPLDVSTHKLGVIEEEHVRGARYTTFDGARYERIIGEPNDEALKPSYGSFSKPASSKATSARGGPTAGAAAGGGGAGDGDGDTAIENTHDKVVVNETFGHVVSEISAASGAITEVENSASILRQSAAAACFELESYGVKHTERQAGAITENVVCPGTIIEQTSATVIQRLTTSALVMEATTATALASSELMATFIRDSLQGAAISARLGPALSLRIGDELDMTMGALVELLLQARTRVALGGWIEADMGVGIEVAGPAVVNATLGLTTEMHLGIKSEFRLGPSNTQTSSEKIDLKEKNKTGLTLSKMASAMFKGVA